MECVICGGTTFGFGPSGRLAVTGAMPRCETCQSLERHRAIRGFFQNIYDPGLFREIKVLQFSKDAAVKPEWFKEYESSIYNGHNSLDLQKIDRASEVYDLVICNHVLEHVPNDGAALQELARVTKSDGIVFLTIPDPARRTRTVDWGFPDVNRHGHFREYGSDITVRFDRYIPSVLVLKISLEDAVTKTADVAYILAHRHNPLLRRIRDAGYDLAI